MHIWIVCVFFDELCAAQTPQSSKVASPWTESQTQPAVLAESGDKPLKSNLAPPRSHESFCIVLITLRAVNTTAAGYELRGIMDTVVILCSWIPLILLHLLKCYCRL